MPERAKQFGRSTLIWQWVPNWRGADAEGFRHFSESVSSVLYSTVNAMRKWVWFQLTASYTMDNVGNVMGQNALSLPFLSHPSFPLHPCPSPSNSWPERGSGKIMKLPSGACWQRPSQQRLGCILSVTMWPTVLRDWPLQHFKWSVDLCERLCESGMTFEIIPLHSNHSSYKSLCTIVSVPSWKSQLL